MRKRKITWDKTALIYFSEAIRYIRKDSEQNANKVKREILTRISELADYPEIHGPDKYKQYNNGNFRAFELHRFRIAYMVKEEEIMIIRIRHTSQEPKLY